MTGVELKRLRWLHRFLGTPELAKRLRASEAALLRELSTGRCTKRTEAFIRRPSTERLLLQRIRLSVEAEMSLGELVALYEQRRLIAETGKTPSELGDTEIARLGVLAANGPVRRERGPRPKERLR